MIERKVQDLDRRITVLLRAWPQGWRPLDVQAELADLWRERAELNNR